MNVGCPVAISGVDDTGYIFKCRPYLAVYLSNTLVGRVDREELLRLTAVVRIDTTMNAKAKVMKLVNMAIAGSFLAMAIPASASAGMPVDQPVDHPNFQVPNPIPVYKGPKYASGQVIVKFKPGVSSARQKRIIALVSGSRKARFGAIRGGLVKPKRGMKIDRMRKLLRRFSDVETVEKDAYMTAFRTPNDTYFSFQYGLTPTGTVNIGAENAWNTKTSCSKVAVLDTGVDTGHIDLKDNLWKNKNETPNNGRDDDKNGYVDDYYGVDLVDGRGSGIDDNGHGTHVAGIVAAKGNNSSGVTGVCWKGNVMSVKFMNRFGLGTTSGAIAGIQYAVKKGAKVINASFGSSTNSKSLEDAVKYAKSKGVLIVAAAGNDSINIDKTPMYPASYRDSNILVVAASTSADTLASFSNYAGNAVDMAAPGENIVSTYPGNKYASLSGTSMAAPMVAGAAGLLRARNSKASYKKLRNALRDTVDRSSAFDGKLYKDGRINLERALDAIK